MRTRRFGLFAVATLIALASCSTNSETRHEAIRKAVEDELRLHPRATLVDIYKHFFQSRFGPGHMIENREFAVTYLRSEMAEAQAFDGVDVQPLGVDSAFYRINLSLLKDSVVTEEGLIDAFVESANSVSAPSIDEWKREWTRIRKVVESTDAELPDFERDIVFLDSLLSHGEAVVHHSETFVDEYDPHYRIVAKRFVPRLLGPNVAVK